MRRMVVIVPELTGYASIRHIAVSLPYASQLIDHVKYMEPQDVKPPEGDTERAPPPAGTPHGIDIVAQSGSERWPSGLRQRS